MNYLSTITLLLVLPLVCGQLSAQKNAIGKPLPNLSLLEWVKPGSIDSNRFEGKIVVVDFWATWCKPCVENFPQMNELVHRFGDRGVEFVAISWDREREKVDSFLANNTVRPMVCIDKKYDIFLKHFKAWGIPYAIVIGRDGAAVWEGYSTALTSEVLEQYITTGTVPEDESLESRTPYYLEVHRALPSDKNGVASDYGIQNYMQITAIPETAVIVNIAYALGLRDYEHTVVGDKKPDFYCATLRIDTALLSEELRMSVFKQLDIVFGTQTKVEYREREVYDVSVSDLVKYNAAKQNSTNGTTPITDPNTRQFNDMRLVSILYQTGQLYNVKFIVDDRSIGNSKFDIVIPANDLEGALKALKELGLTVKYETRKLPFITISQ